MSDVRTSSGTFFGRGETPTIAAVEERIAQWVMVDKGQGEGFQVLDYKVQSRICTCRMHSYTCVLARLFALKSAGTC